MIITYINSDPMSHPTDKQTNLLPVVSSSRSQDVPLLIQNSPPLMENADFVDSPPSFFETRSGSSWRLVQRSSEGIVSCVKEYKLLFVSAFALAFAPSSLLPSIPALTFCLK